MAHASFLHKVRYPRMTLKNISFECVKMRANIQKFYDNVGGAPRLADGFVYVLFVDV